MTSVATLQTTLKLLSDSTRLRLLGLLARDELAVHELVSITGLAQSRVSNHLSLLKRAGLVVDRREGTWAFHRLAKPADDRGALTPELYDAVLRPYHDSADGRVDLPALEAVREQRRERSRSVHDALADRWVEVGQDFTTGALRAEAFCSLVPSGQTVADLGCGAGYLTAFLVERGVRVIAVDHAQRMLATAQSRVGIDIDNLEWRRGEFDQLPLVDAEVDAAFSNLVWHHLADIDRAASEVARVVKPGGRAVVSDLLPHEEEWMREAMGDHRLGMRPEVVVAALARAGFGELVTSRVGDCYRVHAPGGRQVELPLFLVSGVRV